jgi:hypothetical protein
MLGGALSLMFKETSTTCTCTFIVSNYKPRLALWELLNVGWRVQETVYALKALIANLLAVKGLTGLRA